MGKPADSLRQQLLTQVRELMAAQGISQYELARRVKSKQPAIARLLAGKHNPTIDYVDRLIRALEAEPELRLRRKR